MKLKGWIFGTFVLGLLLSSTLYGDCVTVNNNPADGVSEGAQRSTITKAIDNDTTGSVCFTYDLPDGHVAFSSAIIISKNISITNLRMSGKGVEVQSGSVTLQNSSITGVSATAVKLSGGSLTLQKTEIKNSATCISVTCGDLSTVDDSILESCTDVGISIIGGTNHAITDSKISCVNKSGFGIYLSKNAVVQNNEISNCAYGLDIEEAPTLILGATNASEADLAMNKIHDNNIGLNIEGSASNIMFAYNSFYSNTTPLTITESPLSVNVETAGDGGALNCILNEDDSALLKAFMVLENADDSIVDGDKLVVYLIASDFGSSVEQGKDYVATCTLHKAVEADFDNMDDKVTLAETYANKVICDLTGTVEYSNSTCGNGNNAIGFKYRASDLGFDFTSKYSNAFKLEGGVVALVGTLDGPTNTPGDRNTTGNNLETEEGDDPSDTDADLKKQDNHLEDGAGGGGGATSEGAGMSKMCALEPNVSISSKQLSLFAIWWIITFGIFSHFRKEAKKIKK